MVMHSVAFGVGLFLAWCTFEGLRRAMGRLWLVVALVGLVPVARAQQPYYIRIYNNTGSTGTGTIYNHNNAGCSAVLTVRGPASIAAGAYFPSGPGAGVTEYPGGSGAYYYNMDAQGIYGVAVNDANGLIWSDCGFNYTVQHVQTVNLGTTTYTNYFFTGMTFTNTNAFGADYTFRFYTNGVLAESHDFYLPAGEGLTTPGLTNSMPMSWEIIGPGGPSNDYRDVVLAGQNSSALPGQTSQPSYTAGSASQTSGSPWTQVPQQSSGNIPADAAVAARQNAEGIMRSIEGQGNKDTERILGALTNLSFSVTNNLTVTNSMDMGWTNILLNIRTNTAVATNQLAGYTNSLQAAAEDAVNQASNDFAASPYGSHIASGISGVLGTDTNQGPSGAASSVFMASIVGPHGRTWVLNMDPLQNHATEASGQSGLRSTLLSWLNWLRAWILKLVPFVMWWAFGRKMFEFLAETEKEATRAVKNPSAAPWDIAGRLVGALLIGVLALIVGALPTALVAKMQEFSYMTPAIPSLADHVSSSSSGTWGVAAARFYDCLTEGIPFTTVIFALAHYLAFELYGRQLLVSFIWMLRAFKWIVWVLVVASSFQVYAGQVRVLNMDTNQVRWTNYARQIWVQPGETVFNLEDESWGIDGVGPVVIVDPDAPEHEAVIRIGRDESGTLVVDQAWDEGEWSFFWGGYKVGFVIFGLAFAVSSIRAGVNGAVRSSLPD